MPSTACTASSESKFISMMSRVPDWKPATRVASSGMDHILKFSKKGVWRQWFSTARKRQTRPLSWERLPRGGGGDVLAGRFGAVQILVGGGVVDGAATFFHQLAGLLHADDGGADAAEVPHELESALLQPGFAGIDFHGVVVDDRLAAAGLADPEVADDAGPGVEGTLVPLPVVPQDVVHRQVAEALMELHIVADAPGPNLAVGEMSQLAASSGAGRQVGLNGDHTLAKETAGILTRGC